MSNRDIILVNGATGWLGRSILARGDGSPIIAGTRRPQIGGHPSVHIGSDGWVEASALASVKCIINCAGKVTGDRDQVWQANVEHALTLARLARDAGVPRFVQVSSFSVYGDAEQIDRNTPLRPRGLYGNSKSVVETELATLGRDGFSVLSVRLPFMFSAANPAMIGTLIKGFVRLPAIPVTSIPVERSMITYSGAADVLLDAAARKDNGVIVAADPVPFTLAMLARVMQARGLHSPRLVALPRLLTNLTAHLAPYIARRLFRSSLLSGSVNALSEIGSDATVERELGRTLDLLC